MGSYPAAPEAAPEEDLWSDRNQKIIVSPPKDGYLFDLKLRAKLDGTPHEVFDILVEPEANKVFRGIKQVLSREVLEEDGKGKRKLLVGHRALTKFLWLSVTFDTQLYVWEDNVNRTIAFCNARSDGFMKKFEGSWTVQPFTNASLEQIYGSSPGSSSSSSIEGSHHSHHWPNPVAMVSALQKKALPHHPHHQQQTDTLVTLEQALAPRVTPPGPMQGLVRGLCGRVLQNLMGDLRAELQRRKATEREGGKQGDLLQAQGKRAGLPVASVTQSLDLFSQASPLNITILL